MERPEKVATPATTVTAAPPVRVPLPGLAPRARLTVVVLSPVSTLLLASSTATVTAGAMTAPARALVGWVTTASWVGAPTLMLKADEVAEVKEGVLEATR